MIVKFAIDSIKAESAEVLGESAFACVGERALWEPGKGACLGSVASSGVSFSVIDGVSANQQGIDSVEGVIEQFKSLLKNAGDVTSLTTSDLRHLSEDGSRKAHELLLQLSEVEGVETQMIASVASLLVGREEILFSSEGNCRVYRFRDSVLELLSEDDTEAWELVEKGKATPDQLKTYPGYKKLTHVIGGKGNMKPKNKVQIEHVEMGDVFLLCSDGLNDILSSSAIEAELSQSIGNEGEVSLVALDSLLSLAKSKNQKENLTVILCQVYPKSSKWTSLISAL